MDLPLFPSNPIPFPGDRLSTTLTLCAISSSTSTNFSLKNFLWSGSCVSLVVRPWSLQSWRTRSREDWSSWESQKGHYIVLFLALNFNWVFRPSTKEALLALLSLFKCAQSIENFSPSSYSSFRQKGHFSILPRIFWEHQMHLAQRTCRHGNTTGNTMTCLQIWQSVSIWGAGAAGARRGSGLGGGRRVMAFWSISCGFGFCYFLMEIK